MLPRKLSKLSKRKWRGKTSFRPSVESLESRLVPTASSSLALSGTSYPLVEANFSPLTGGSSSPAPAAFTPAQIKAAYGITTLGGTNNISFNGTLGTGAGETIAIVDAYDDPDLVDSTAANFATSDLGMFDAQFGLTNSFTFTKYNQTGGTTGLPGIDPTGAGNSNGNWNTGNWETEEALDVEWAHAIAPMASIDLIECTSSSNANLYAGVKVAASLPGVCVVSMSFGSPEISGETANDSLFVTPAGHQPVTFLAASGDFGSPGDYPAYSPNVVSVGGTTLYVNSNGSYDFETGWGNGSQSGSLGGSGGGTSKYETEPAFQDGVQDTGKRSTPDVSFDADPFSGVAIYDSYNNKDGKGPWEDVGGTSLGSPAWAGLIAIADQLRSVNGLSTLNGSSQTLPALYSLPSTDFNDDITSGSNGGFTAQAGYNEVTGLGTPIANLLVPDLVRYQAVTFTPATLPTAFLGSAYNQTLTANAPEGTTIVNSPIVVTSGSVPAGLTITVNAGTDMLTVTGLPTAVGSVTFNVTTTNTIFGLQTTSFTLVSKLGLAFTPAVLPDGTALFAYNQTIAVVGGTGVYTSLTYTLTGKTTIPPGMQFAAITNNSQLAITGTPTASDTVTFTLTVVDSSGTKVSANYTLVINPAVQLVPLTIPTGTVGAVYDQVFTSSGGTGSLVLTDTALNGSLPLGLSFTPGTSQLTLSGIPAATGSFTFSVTATDSIGATATQTYTLTVNPALNFNIFSIPADTVGVAYSQTITATGGTGADVASITDTLGSVPTGLTVAAKSNQVTITGTPTVPGSYDFTVNGTDSAGDVISNSYDLVVNPRPSFSPGTVPASTEGVAYSSSISVSGGTGTLTLSSQVAAGVMPTGLSINQSANAFAIMGFPTTVGTVTIRVQATDALGATTAQNYTLTINPAVGLVPSSLPRGTVGAAYNQTIVPSGGTGAYTIVESEVGVPNGIVVTNTGTSVTIVGTPTTMGTGTINVQATDAVGSTISLSYTLTVNPQLDFTPASPLATGTVGVPYSQTITAAGGVAPILTTSFSITSGPVPAGLLIATIGNSIAISGTPTTSGTVIFNAIVTDSGNDTISQSYTFTIDPAVSLTPSANFNDTVGVADNQTITASNGTGAKLISYAIATGIIPTGLTFNIGPNDLVLSGTPTAAGAVTILVEAEDSLGAMASQSYTFNVNPVVTLSPAVLPQSTVAVPYAQQVIGPVGGTGPVTLTYKVVGTLPAGLTLVQGGNQLTLGGTPTAVGSATIAVTAKDSLGVSTSQNYTVTINPAVTISPTSTLPLGVVGGVYGPQTLTATGGTGSSTFTEVVKGTLPAGLMFTAGVNTLTLSGTPTVTGTFSFTATATDCVGATASHTYTVTIDPAVTLTVLSLPASTQGVAYYETIGVSGGISTNKTPVVTPLSGSLPLGMKLTTTNNLLSVTGTPTKSGTYTFQLKATDAGGNSATSDYTLVINQPVTLTPASIPAGTAGVFYDQTITATGGTGYLGTTYKISSGSVPTGLVITNANGAITVIGTPATKGSFTLKVTAFDSVGAQVAQTYTVTINTPVTFALSSLAHASIGTNYSQTITAVGGTGTKTLTYDVLSGSIPPGLTITPAPNELKITGRPTAHGTITIKVIATDAVGDEAWEILTLTV